MFFDARDATISFLTDLDTIFDTRMGVIDSFGVKAVIDVVKGGYFSRTIDIFNGIDMEEFNARYAARDLSVLRKSMVSAIRVEITRFMWKTHAASVSSPLVKRPRLVVNTYPYKLDEGSLNTLQLGIVYMVNSRMEVAMIHEKPEDISLKDIKENYAMLALYHYDQWLEGLAVNKQLEKVQCPQIQLLGPRIVKSTEGLSLLKVRDVFADIEEYTSLFFKLRLLPSQMFSTDMDRLAHVLKNEKTAA